MKFQLGFLLSLVLLLTIACRTEPTMTPIESLPGPTETPPQPTEVAAAEIPPTEVPATATAVPPTPTIGLIEVTAVPTATPEPTLEPIEAAAFTWPGQEIFNFVEGEPGWFTVDDDVMGGVSSSTVEITAEDVMLFTGNMSLDNNGGFSSVRSSWSPTDYSDADGVLIRFRGDGKVYRLRIRTERAGREVSYNALFESEAGEWKVVYIPFDEMVPTVRGFLVDTGPLDAGSIGSFGFMLSDKQPGEFEIEIDWIRTVTNDDVQTLSN